MKNLKNKIVALVSALCALAAFIGFAPAAAMADETDSYGANVTVNGTTATVTVNFRADEIAQYGEYVYVEADSKLVAQVVPAADIQNAEVFYAGHVTAEKPTVTFTFKLTSAATCQGGKVEYNVYLGKNKVVNNNEELTDAQTAQADLSKVLYSGSANVPAVGNTCAPTSNNNGTTANTGASVLPYGIAVVLLALAGAAVLAVRKQQVRR